MKLFTTVVILVSVFIRRSVVSQKTISYYDEYEDSEIRQLHSEIEIIRQMIYMYVQEEQLSEMRILLKGVNRFMEELHTNYSMSDCLRSQPTLRHSYLTSGAGHSNHAPGASDKSVSLIVRLDISDRWVYGVTKLHNLIYVLCYNPNSIMVSEDQAPFVLREIETKQIRSPYNIVASEPWNCLFVIDIGNHCIWKITADNDTVTLWLSDLVHVTALSVTNDGRHILIINQDDTSHNLEIYGLDAELTDRIHLHDLGIPLYAVQTSSGGFIVCHKMEDDEDSDDVWLISEIDAEGTLVRSSSDDDEAHLSEPSHLFIDSNDRLFVADRWSSRVILFDAELNWNQTILSEERDGVQLPLRIYFDDKDLQLIVISGAGGGEKVDVYSYVN